MPEIDALSEIEQTIEHTIDPEIDKPLQQLLDGKYQIIKLLGKGSQEYKPVLFSREEKALPANNGLPVTTGIVKTVTQPPYASDFLIEYIFELDHRNHAGLSRSYKLYKPEDIIKVRYKKSKLKVSSWIDESE